MARVIVGAVLESITGRLGTSSFLKHKGGHSLRRTPTMKKGCKSPAQQSARANLARAAHAWSLLTPAQRATWEEYAQGLRSGPPSYDKERAGGSGNRVLISKSWGIMSGYNAFLRNNLTARAAGWTALVSEAPIGIPPPLPILGLVITSIPPYYDVSVRWTNLPPYDTNTRIQVLLSIPTGGVATQISQTMTYYQTNYVIMRATVTCGNRLFLTDTPGERLVVTRRVSSEGQASSSGETVITPGFEP